jgi:hypothetical protein
VLGLPFYRLREGPEIPERGWRKGRKRKTKEREWSSHRGAVCRETKDYGCVYFL